MKMRFRTHICWLILVMLVLACAGCGKVETANVMTDELSAEAVTEKADESSTEITNTEDITVADQENTQETEEPKAVFPIVLEDGKLTIESMFQSSIPNPDKDFEDAADVASIELVNQSEEYLKKADIEITLQDGTNLIFQVCDIPAGKTVWAFDLANTAIAAEHPYKEVQCEAEFDEAYIGWDSQFEVDSELFTAEVTNLTGQEQKNIKVRFHCVMEGIYFGGTSYEYNIEKLSPQESATLEVVECYFGDAEAVQIIY